MSLQGGKNANSMGTSEQRPSDLCLESSPADSSTGDEAVVHRLNTTDFSDRYDRAQVAAFMLENGPRVRRRVRGKLGEMLRRTVDSEDILSTVIRRLDRFAASGRLRAESEGELWALVTKITDAALADKVRRKQRQDLLKSGLTLIGGPGLIETSVQTDGTNTCSAAKSLVQDIASQNKSDAEITALWARGLSHPAIAASLGQGTHEVRSRWQLIKRRLRKKSTQ